MKVLVTGGLGFIGSHTCVELLESGHEVVVIDNNSNSDPSVKESIEKITGKEFELIIADACEPKSYEGLKDVDAVIHFAALKAVGESVDQPLAYYKNNLLSTIESLRFVTDNSVSSYVFSSSATVYGDPEYLPIDEQHPLSATNPYGQSKLFCEQMISDSSKTKPDMKAIILRYFNPAGAHPSGLIGENPKGKPNNLMPYVAKVAQGELDEISVFGDDYGTEDGTGVRDYLHVVDLAKAHVAALESSKVEAGVTRINLGTGKGYSVLELIKSYSKACGEQLAYKIAPRRPGDIAACYAAADRAKDILGWEAEKSLDDMCRDSWKWIA